VLRGQGRSLLAVGVIGCKGKFAAGDVVNIAGPDGKLVARGKTAYASDDIAKVSGQHEHALRALFPARKHLEVVHRDNLVLL